MGLTNEIIIYELNVNKKTKSKSLDKALNDNYWYLCECEGYWMGGMFAMSLTIVTIVLIVLPANKVLN